MPLVFGVMSLTAFSSIPIPWTVFVVTTIFTGFSGYNVFKIDHARKDSPTEAAWIHRSAGPDISLLRTRWSKPSASRLFNLKAGMTSLHKKSYRRKAVF